MSKKKILIIDDSALVRNALSGLIETTTDLEVMGTAADPYFAAEKLKKNIPDAITLDIEMPRMDGITFLKTLMSQYPVPVVIVSSLTEKGSQTALQALRYGAVDVINKPGMHGIGEEVEENRLRILEAIRAATLARVHRRSATEKSAKTGSPTNNGSQPTAASMLKTSERIVVIGASTGGTEAIRTLLAKLPSDAHGTAIVQHMPEKFTRSFAESLNAQCKVQVKEAEDGDSLLRGTVLIAPGNKHMYVKRSGARYYVQVKEGPLVNRHRPSVDVLFRSAANYVGKNCTGILLTGMGADGAKGMLEMKEAGAVTIAQDEASSVVFGMPREAIKLGGASRIASLAEMHRLMV